MSAGGNLTTPVVVEVTDPIAKNTDRKVIDYEDRDDRKWLQRLQWFAMHNGRKVTVTPQELCHG
jgi:hypothetical protein